MYRMTLDEPQQHCSNQRSLNSTAEQKVAAANWYRHSLCVCVYLFVFHNVCESLAKMRIVAEVQDKAKVENSEALPRSSSKRNLKTFNRIFVFNLFLYLSICIVVFSHQKMSVFYQCATASVGWCSCASSPSHFCASFEIRMPILFRFMCALLWYKTKLFELNETKFYLRFSEIKSLYAHIYLGFSILLAIAM